MVTIEEVLAAYLDCRKHKRNKQSTLAFEANLPRNIYSLTQELSDGSYTIGASRCFVVTAPAPREVWAASFRDRVVHHVLYSRMAPLFIPTFSAASSACLPGRGTLYGSQRLERFIRSGTQNWQKEMYFLQMDVSNFFVSIQKDILSRLHAEKIHCPWTLRLAEQVLRHDPTQNYVFSGDHAKLTLVPPHKSLFNTHPCMGLPIGNLPSQFDANIYMNVLDQYVQHTIKPQGYVRYVDDFVLVDTDIEKIKDAKDAIEQFLWERLLLILNPTKTKMGSVYQGVDFVGRIIQPHHTTPRPRLERNAMRAIRSNQATAEGITSRLGLMRQSKSYTTRQRVVREALRVGYTVDPRGTKVFDYGRR
jgi:hypothetical protein